MSNYDHYPDYMTKTVSFTYTVPGSSKTLCCSNIRMAVMVDTQDGLGFEFRLRDSLRKSMNLTDKELRIRRFNFDVPFNSSSRKFTKPYDMTIFLVEVLNRDVNTAAVYFTCDVEFLATNFSGSPSSAEENLRDFVTMFLRNVPFVNLRPSNWKRSQNRYVYSPRVFYVNAPTAPSNFSSWVNDNYWNKCRGEGECSLCYDVVSNKMNGTFLMYGES